MVSRDLGPIWDEPVGLDDVFRAAFRCLDSRSTLYISRSFYGIRSMASPLEAA